MRLIPTLSSLAPLLVITAAKGAEITLEAKPFLIERSLSATALPAEPSVFRIAADSWPAFEIRRIAAHGSRVNAGDTLVEFDNEALDRKLEDGRKALDAANLNFAQAEVDLRSLKDNFALKLDATKRAARNATDDLAYFKTISRKSQEERAAEVLKRSKQALENEQEELRQLEKMYKADDLTEETEEIILVRQRDSVASAEFAVRMATQENKRTLETTLPRQAEEYEAAAKSTTLALAKAESDLPRQIELKEIEVSNARTALTRQKEDFQKLTEDRKEADPVKAAVAGWFYHGAIEDGKWSPAEATKPLVPTAQVAAHKAYATFIPATATLSLVAFTDEGTARSLPKDGTGVLVLSGHEDLSPTATLKAVSETPDGTGRYRVDLTAGWPSDAAPVPGSTGQVRLISYENPAAIVVPAGALKLGKDGWNVSVKLADGKPGPKPVKRGRASGDQVEILSGLEPGQVVITP